MALRALPGGESAGAAVTIGTVQGGTFPPVAVDQSRGRFHDRVYVAALRGSSIVAFWSADEGHSWFGPTVVRTADAPSDPSLDPIVFNPGLAVNRDGVVAVGWGEGAHARTDGVYVRSWSYRMAASWDGGATFSDAVTVSSDRHDLSRWGLISFIGSIRRDDSARQIGSIMVDPFADSGGHTFGLTADSEGVFHAAWTDNRTGVPQVWTAAVTAK
jgi:hypothetical protein